MGRLRCGRVLHWLAGGLDGGLGWSAALHRLPCAAAPRCTDWPPPLPMRCWPPPLQGCCLHRRPLSAPASPPHDCPGPVVLGCWDVSFPSPPAEPAHLAHLSSPPRRARVGVPRPTGGPSLTWRAPGWAACLPACLPARPSGSAVRWLWALAPGAPGQPQPQPSQQPASQRAASQPCRLHARSD